MAFLSQLHRWTGGVVGILLAVIGLTGTVLLWEDSWILLEGAGSTASVDPQSLARAVSVATEQGSELSRITFAGDEIGLHQAIYSDGSGAYIAQDGRVIERWASLWERPELWLFELHHYLLLGEAGKVVTGILGILLLAFCLTGIVLWWRTRKTFRFRVWPARYTQSAIVRHHRDLGVVASPLLILAAATGTMMVFPAISDLVLAPLATSDTDPGLPSGLQKVDGSTDWSIIMSNAAGIFPGAEPRRLTMPAEPGAPVTLRYRQEFEWTPNGRSYVWLDPANGKVVAVKDPAVGDTASAVVEKFYPIHAAKVGGLLWRLAMTFAGVALTMLGLLASWSFWRARVRPRQVIPRAAS
ncbi:PepSY domain-containing protein [Erythrobacter sp. SDW2]|uniref:PepSY-associated TM helix domain-containing protein n=1 Tax=Erythrobacter sp. SDW2 TaxID=2907154 RepID=UPI001F17EFA8|nr:PepSY-associated TM helix domain-containing protein [Erythrobacter sp. SDW2]UIP06087.1 PepSY domain-containing protein [Erythrobacter sp. SDW2]